MAFMCSTSWEIDMGCCSSGLLHLYKFQIDLLPALGSKNHSWERNSFGRYFQNRGKVVPNVTNKSYMISVMRHSNDFIYKHIKLTVIWATVLQWDDLCILCFPVLLQFSLDRVDVGYICQDFPQLLSSNSHV